MTLSKENETVLSDAEKQVRRGWLWSLWASIAASLIFCAITYHTGFNGAGEVLLSIMDSAIVFLLLFFLAYKKFGTKWIACYLFLSPISMAWELSKTSAIGMPAGAILETGWIWAALVVSLFVYICFWVQSLRLYLLNRNIKKRKKQTKNAIPETAVAT